MNKIFKNIIGYEKEKKTLERLVDVLNNKEKYKDIGSTIPHGLLLHGDPGLGKTTISKEILNNVSNRKIYTIRKIKSDGDFINYMNDIFKQAKENQPSIILLDDLDKYSEDDNSRNNEEFVTVQSFIDDIKNDDIFVIATANDIDVLPQSLLRAGRFDIKIRINHPDEKESYELLKYYLKNKKIDKDVNLKNISYILGCKSCADFEKVCNQAGIYAAFNNKKKIGMEELLKASLELSYDTCIEDLNEKDEYALETAYHEAGHAIVGEYLEPGSISFITIVKTNSNTKGFTKYHNNENYDDDIRFMKNRLTTLLGGKAATEIIFNKCDTGANSDLSRAFSLAERFVDNYCMNDFNSWLDSFRDNTADKIKLNRNESASKLVDEYYNKAKNILIENRDRLNTLANILKDKKILFQDEIEDIYNNTDKYLNL